MRSAVLRARSWLACLLDQGSRHGEPAIEGVAGLGTENCSNGFWQSRDTEAKFTI